MAGFSLFGPVDPVLTLAYHGAVLECDLLRDGQRAELRRKILGVLEHLIGHREHRFLFVRHKVF